jgi:hypothetical protein
MNINNRFCWAMTLSAASLVAVFFAAGCPHHGERSTAMGDRPTNSATQNALSAYATADPVKDLSAAVARGDLRFIGLHEFGELIPGAQNRPDLTAKYGVRMVSGTSDTALKSQQDAVEEYAEIYNLLLIRQLRSKDDKLTTPSADASSPTAPSGSSTPATR